MKSKFVISGLSAALLLAALPVVGQSQDETAVVTVEAPDEVPVGATCPLDSTSSCMLGSVRMGNPMDPNSWWDGGEGMDHNHDLVAFNPADPDFLTQIPNPQTHSAFHMSMTNPENWAQFMTPDTFMRIMNPENIQKWADPENFKVLTDLQTYAYWAQPGAYMHAMDPENYTQLMNPTAYMNLFKEVTTAWAALAADS